MATAIKSEGNGGRRFRPTQAQRHAARASTRAEAPHTAQAPRVNVTQGDAQGDAPLGTIMHGYNPGDKRLFRVTRPAAHAEWRDVTEPTARIGDFRAWLRSRSYDVVVGVAASAERDPIATWLRETGGYGRVIVRAGQAGFAGEGTARAAHYQVCDRRGFPLGMGYLDMGLTLALDWLDGAGLNALGAPRLLTAGEVATLLMEMSAVWPSPERQAQMAQLTAASQTPAQPRIVHRVGIASGR